MSTSPDANATNPPAPPAELTDAAKQREERKKAEKEAKKAKLAQKLANKQSNVKEAVKDTLSSATDKLSIKEKKRKDIDTYNPPAIEGKWYKIWEENKLFTPQIPDHKLTPGNAYVIASPPPNVTGALHIGHALTIAIQDTLARFNRMRGKTVLYLVGFDHAGISTQSVVEKALWKNEKKTKHQLSDKPEENRPKFLEYVMKWKEEYHLRITDQMKKIGASFDWSREAFTMDANLSKAVRETFIRLHKEKLIYRDNRLVNWCGHFQTALSNIEVENKELEGRTLLDVPGYEGGKVEFGVLHSFDYAFDDGQTITVATTRIETMLGDVAIAVNPKDERYASFHGKSAQHPFLDRKIVVLADEIADMTFGTGAVKITPAHDPNDFQVGKRHNLPFINILNDNGTLNGNAGEFENQHRFEARWKVIKALKDKGLYKGFVDNKMSIPLCLKSRDIIEPMIKPQWWLKQGVMAKEALDSLDRNEFKIHPNYFSAEFRRWLNPDTIQDWCISRQLWWGHRIPAYLIRLEGEDVDAVDDKYWVSGETEEDVYKQATERFPGKKFVLEQDEDVLDTWFSSGLWPFSTLGWPNENSPDYKAFYPNTFQETGWDILFFWIARMIMFGIHLTGQVPFPEIYCHALIRDKDGRKMSKSLGNVIDPLDVISGIKLKDLHAKLATGNLEPKEVKRAEQGQKAQFPNGIPECGADAMRYTVLSLSTGSRDINLDVARVDGYRRFCNKMYQATNFALKNLGIDFKPTDEIDLSGKVHQSSKWILHTFNEAVKDTITNLEHRNFHQATETIYRYWRDELCDVYIECCKALSETEYASSSQQILYHCLDGALRLIHPIMPFVTEELWQRLPRLPSERAKYIMISAYPEFKETYKFEHDHIEFEKLLEEKGRGLISKHLTV